MTHDEVLGGVAAIVGQQFSVPAHSVATATTALQIPGWDSITHVHLLLEVERVFGIEFPEERVFDMANVGELVDVVVACLAAQGR